MPTSTVGLRSVEEEELGPSSFHRLNKAFAKLVVRDYLQNTPGYEGTLAAFLSDSAAIVNASASAGDSHASAQREDSDIDAWYTVSGFLRLPDLLMKFGSPPPELDEGGTGSIVEVSRQGGAAACVRASVPRLRAAWTPPRPPPLPLPTLPAPPTHSPPPPGPRGRAVRPHGAVGGEGQRALAEVSRHGPADYQGLDRHAAADDRRQAQAALALVDQRPGAQRQA